MFANPRSRQIADVLSDLWDQAKLPDFVEYVRTIYRVEVSDLPNFRCIYIGETEDGDLERGPTPGLIKHWWIRDGQGIREVKNPKMDWEGEGDFVPTPLLLFYHEGEGITVSERLGQELACWKSGRFHIADDRASIDDLRILDL